MRELLKKEMTFNWTKGCTAELEDLKTALISKPILGPIDENNDNYLTVDGSKLGIGGHIFEKRPNGQIYTCTYYSSATTKSQQTCPSYALEMQAETCQLAYGHLNSYDCVRGTGPAYFKDVCTPVIDIAGRSNLRSAQCGDMFVLRTRTEFGRRSFHVTASPVWNALPTHLRSTTISRGQFRAGLKTYLFNLAFYTDSL